MKKERIPFKKGRTLVVISDNTAFTKGDKVVIVVPSSIYGEVDVHREFGMEMIMVTRPHLYDRYKDMTPNDVYALWRRTSCMDEPIYVYEDFRFEHVAENNSDHARFSLEVLD